MRGDVWTYQCDTTRSTVEFSDGNRIQTVRHERADDGKTYSASMKVTLIKSGMREPPPGVEIADQPVRGGARQAATPVQNGGYWHPSVEAPVTSRE